MSIVDNIRMLAACKYIRAIVYSILMAGCFFACPGSSFAQVSPYSLLTNGDFESGGSGNGFQVPAPFVFLGTPPPLTGTSSPGDYAIIPNPQPMNTANFISGTDHSGSGKMMVVDGTTVGGGQRFWKAGNTGGGVGPLTIGATYTFSYWKKTVSTTAVDASTAANISVAWNNASSVTLVAGSEQVSFPGVSSVWQQVKYSFIPTSAFVNIELYNNNSNSVGNDFAIDDVEVLPPPVPLSLRYSIVEPGCPNSSDGSVALYGSGGNGPYTYSFNASGFTANNLYTGLGPTFYPASVRDLIPNQVNAIPLITLTAPTDPLSISNGVSICLGQAAQPSANAVVPGTFNWTASPPDPTLVTPNINSPAVAPLVTTTYTVTFTYTRTRNLVYNGDFSLGDAGFYTEYSYLASNAAGAQWAYGITNNPNLFEPGFSNACTDHTGSSGNMMVVDGATNGTSVVWRQKIAVNPGTNYTFSYWLQSVAIPATPASIEAQINGTPITGSAVTSTLTAGALCGWVQYSFTWNSGANTFAEISLIDRTTAASGNDFALDDISFTTATTCVSTKNVVISVSPPSVTGFSYTTPVCANAGSISPTLVSGFTTGGTFSSTAGLSLNTATGDINVSASIPGTYTVTYSVGSSGCSLGGTFNTSITISPITPPVTGFSYTSPVCTTAGNQSPTLAGGFSMGGTFSSTAGLSINSSTGVINPAASTPGSYTITYAIAAIGCQPSGSNTASITISAAITPVTGFSYTSPVCSNAANQSPTLSVGFTSGGTFSSSAGLSINAATGVINVAASTPGTYFVNYNIAASGCQLAGSNNGSITINPTITPVTSFSYTSPVCSNASNQSPILAGGFTTGGIYSSTAGLSINASTGAINVAASTPGTYVVSYNIAASGCRLAGSGTNNIVINPVTTPVTGFSYSTPICTSAGNQSPILNSGFASGGTFSSTAGLSINSSTGVINVAASTPGSYNITYSIAAIGCQLAGSQNASVTISSTISPVTSFAYTSPVCATASSQTPSLSGGFAAGGTFTSTAGLSINSSTGQINVAASTPGSYTVTYNIAAAGCQLAGTGTAGFTINPTVSPVTGFSYATPICANAGNQSPILSGGFSTGGSFSSTAGLSINASTGVVNIAASTPGAYTIAYNISASGCQLAGSNTASILISPIVIPVTSFSYTSPVCSNAGIQAPALTSGFTPGGTFSSTPGLSVNASTGFINVAGSTPGTYVITYTIAAVGCQIAGSNTASMTISSTITPVTAFSYATPVCSNAGNQPPTLSPGFTTGGTFSSNAGLSINAGTGDINVGASTPGSYTVTYNIPASGCQLAGSNTANININPTITPVTGFSYTSPVCSNAGNQSPILTAGFTGGGTFSSTAGLSINPGTGVINVAASTPGSYSIAYNVAASGCQLAGSQTATITITATTNPVTGFSYASPVCSNTGNQTASLAPGFTTGGIFSSTAGLSINGANGVINTSTSTPGTYTITYMIPSSGCRLAGTNTASITINSTSTPVTGFSYTTPVCSNAGSQSPLLTAGFTNGGTFSSTAGLSINTATGVIDVAASTPGSYTVAYNVAASGCQLAGSNTASISINPSTTPITGFSYTTPVCSNAASQTPVMVPGFTTGGTFSSTAGLALDPNTGVINVASSTTGTYIISYSIPSSGCQLAGTGTATITISSTINPVTGFSYTSPVCSNSGNQTPSLAVGFSPGGSFGSTMGLSINSSTGVINTAASIPGLYTITYTIAAIGCQFSGSGNTSITINPNTNPVTGFSYTSPVCSNAGNQSPILVSGFNTGGTFSSTAGLSINSSTGVIDVAASTPGSYSVAYNIPANGCQLAGSNTASININSTITPVTGFSYSTPVCSNAAIQSPILTTGFTTGGTFSSTAGLSINSTTGVIDVAASTPGSYSVAYNVAASGCQLAGSNNASITISSTVTPLTSFSYTTPVCSNAGNQSPILTTGFTSGGTFSSTAGLSINSTTGVIDVAASTPGSYTVAYNIAASGCQLAGSNNASITISSTVTPVTGFSYTTPVCSNAASQSPTLVSGFTSGGTFSSTSGLSINSSTGVIDVAASTPGSYSVAYNIAASGCQLAGSNTASININSTITPVTGFSYSTPVCSNAGIQAPALTSGFTPGGTFSSTAGLSINSTTGVIDVAASTPGSYSVAYNVAASGCQLAGSNNASITISSTVTPLTSFSYTTPVCSNAGNQSPILTTGFTSGGTFSSTAGLSINSSTGVIDVAASTPGSYNVTYNIAASGCQLAGSNNASITISSTVSPVTSFSYTTPVCSNAANQSPTLVSGFTTGGTFSSTAGLSINISTGVIDMAASTPGSYTVAYNIAASGCQLAGSNNASITISSTVTPVTGFSYTTPVCSNAANQSPTLVSGFTTGGTFSSTAGLSINSTTGVINVAASTPGSYSVAYNVAASGCQLAGSNNASITISSTVTPVTGFSYTTPVCSNAGNQSPILTTGFTTGGTFSSTAGLSINSTTGVIDVAASTPGSYTVAYNIATSGCQLAGFNTASININSTITPVTGFSYTTPVCSNATNQSPTLVSGFTSGGTFSSTAGLSINSTTGVIDVAASTPGSYTIAYNVAASGCQLAGSNNASITISSTVTPVTGFSYTTPVCSNAASQSPTLVSGFTSGGTFSSTAGLSINSTTGVIDVAASTPGSYNVAYNIAASGCQLAGSNNASITISSTVTPVTGFSYTTPICSNAAIQSPTLVSGFTTGGTFSSTAGLSINSSTGVIDVAASTPGSYSVAYNIAASGCQLAGSNNASITISSTVTPVTGFSYTTPVCSNAANQSPIFVSGFTTGGTFSSTAGLSINSSTGVINVAASTPGSYNVAYNIAASGCQLAGSNNASITISSTVTPVTGFSYTTPVCSNAANQSPTLVSGFNTGGTFSSTAGLSINSTTGVINVAASTPGSYNVAYNIAASGCQLAGSNNASITISSTVTPVTGFSYTTPVCSNAASQSPTLVSGFTSGGTFSSTAGLSINSTTGVIDVAASTPGSYTVAYNIATSGCQLAGFNTASININSTITPVTGFSYTTPVCSNATNQSPTLVSGFTSGGTFSSTAGLSINSTTGVIDVAASTPGSYSVAYNIAASGCQLAGFNTASININSTITPVTGFSYTTPVCSNATNQSPTLVSGFTSGGTFSSTAGLSINSSTGVIDVAASTPGSYNVTYNIAASGCQLAGSNNASITISSTVTPVTGFSYTTPVCSNATNQSPTLVSGFTSGGTFSSTAGLSINSTTGVIDVAASTPGSYSVAYNIPASGCQLAGSNNASITISSTVTPVTDFSYTTPVCSNAAIQSPTLVSGFTTGGTFSSTAGLSINSTTGVIDVAASTPGSYNVTYNIAASGCQLAGSNNASITISSTVTPVTGFNYTTPVCSNAANQSPTLVSGFTTGGTFSSTAGLSINSTTGVIDVAASTPGSYSVAYNIPASGCQIAGSNSANININLTPGAPVVTNGSLCGAGPVNLSASGQGILNWYSDAGLANQVNTGSLYQPILSNSSTFYVQANNNGCLSPVSAVTATIHEIPAKPELGPSQSLCPGDRITLNAGNYASYNWSTLATTPTLTVTNPGLYYVVVGNGTGCTQSDSVNILAGQNCEDIYFPTAFSPNGDGQNDQFGPLGNVAAVSDYTLIIYNRFGQLVFRSNSVYGKWDGRYKSLLTPNTNYVWFCNYRFQGGAIRQKKGNLLLIK